MLFDPNVANFVENLFNQKVVLPILGVAMVIFIKWLWWTLEGSGINQGPSR